MGASRTLSERLKRRFGGLGPKGEGPVILGSEEAFCY